MKQIAQGNEAWSEITQKNWVRIFVFETNWINEWSRTRWHSPQLLCMHDKTGDIEEVCVRERVTAIIFCMTMPCIILHWGAFIYVNLRGDSFLDHMIIRTPFLHPCFLLAYTGLSLTTRIVCTKINDFLFQQRSEWILLLIVTFLVPIFVRSKNIHNMRISCFSRLYIHTQSSETRLRT